VARSQVSRTRRSQIAHEARRACSLAQADGRTVDEIQEELLRTFPGELAAGEARMYALGWTVGVVREGLQALAAEEGLEPSGLQDIDVSRWLRGEVYPRESLERLCRLFRCHQAQLGWPPRGNDVAISFGPDAPRGTTPAVRPYAPGGIVEAPRSEPADHRWDWAAWFGLALSRLMALIDRWEDARSSEALQVLVHQEVLMFDAVRPARDEDHGYDPSRRQLLVTLLALPVALTPALQLGGVSAAPVRRLLTECGASITAAWHLLKQSDLAIVEQHVSGYVLALAALARQPSPHQAEAARLASQAHRVLGIVAMHRRQFGLVDHHYRQALQYAEIAGDLSLQASALLAASSHALINKDDVVGAAASHQRLLGQERQITPLQRSKLHCSLAIEIARAGQEGEALRRMHLAEVEYPVSPEHDASFTRQDFGPGQLVLFRGLTHLALARGFPDRHYQQQAWDTFEQVGRLAGQGAVAERIRVEIVNHQAATALEMRDLESFVSHLRSAVQGARHLGSALRMHEAATNWRHALQVWPDEPRVTALAELFADPPMKLSADRR
jgi:hypothetical protein